MSLEAVATTKADVRDHAAVVHEVLTRTLAIEVPAAQPNLDDTAVILTAPDEPTRAELAARYPPGARADGVRVVVIANPADALERVRAELLRLDLDRPIVNPVGTGADALADVYLRTESDRRRALARFGRDYFGLRLRYDLLIQNGPVTEGLVSGLLLGELLGTPGMTSVGSEVVAGVPRVQIGAADEAARQRLRDLYAEGSIQGVPIEVHLNPYATRLQQFTHDCRRWLSRARATRGG